MWWPGHSIMRINSLRGLWYEASREKSPDFIVNGVNKIIYISFASFVIYQLHYKKLQIIHVWPFRGRQPLSGGKGVGSGASEF
jgi:hypothetical protein